VRAVAREPWPVAHREVRHGRPAKLGFAATDLICLLVGLVGAGIVDVRAPVTSAGVLLLCAAATGWLVTFTGFGLNRTDLLSAPEELRRIVSATSVGVVLTVVASSLLSIQEPAVAFVLLWAVATGCELGARRVWRWYLARLRVAGTLALRALVIGTDAGAARVGAGLTDPRSGFEPIGFVATASSISYPDGGPTIPIPLLGVIERLERLIVRHRADCVFVISGCVSPEEMLLVCRICRRKAVEVRVSANLPETLTSRVTLQDVNGTMALCIRPVQLRGVNAALKRTCDVVIASAGLIVLAIPSMIVVGAIRLSSPGPALFRQARVTKGGRRFTIYKFRTMRCDAGASPVDASVPFFKMQTDPRVTRVGSFLRRFSIDEWPQLWNVLRGEMSLVGPRPLSADQVGNVEAQEVLLERQEVRAGLTGWWQINGRNDVTPEEAFRLDAFYVENWSLTLDLYILLKTAGALFAHRGAY
jgi:exopolysaccharide biosynthesis polyprenyl glycosylphosphotransferase